MLVLGFGESLILGPDQSKVAYGQIQALLQDPCVAIW